MLVSPKQKEWSIHHTGFYTCIWTLKTANSLRNRKHFPCFYRVIETWVEVWENEKCCGNTSRRRVFPLLFRVLPNFNKCFYNSIETWRKCFLFLLENSPLWLMPVTRTTFLFVSSYRNTIFNHILLSTLYNGNRTEWSPIRSVIIRVINKIGRHFITSMITDWIGRHKVLLPINRIYNEKEMREGFRKIIVFTLRYIVKKIWKCNCPLAAREMVRTVQLHCPIWAKIIAGDSQSVARILL